MSIIGIAVNLRNTEELESISSQPSSVFVHKVPSFKQLRGLIPTLVPPLCHGKSSTCTDTNINSW